MIPGTCEIAVAILYLDFCCTCSGTLRPGANPGRDMAPLANRNKIQRVKGGAANLMRANGKQYHSVYGR